MNIYKKRRDKKINKKKKRRDKYIKYFSAMKNYTVININEYINICI